MNYYIQMLVMLLEGVIVPRAVMRCIFSTDRTARDNILRGIKNKHVKEIRFEAIHDTHKRTINALILTPVGLSYLYQNYFCFFHDFDKSLAPYIAMTSPFGKEGMNTKTKRTIAEYAYVAGMAMTAGATTHFPLTDRSEYCLHFLMPEIIEHTHLEITNSKERPCEGKHSFRDLLRVITDNRHRDDTEEETRQNLNDYPISPMSPDYIEYIPRPAMKRAILYIYKNGGIEYSSRDYDRCRNRGVLQSHFRSVLLFTNFECGFRWIKVFIETDMTVYRHWQRALKKELRGEVMSNKECGAVFVDNPRHFSQIYNDSVGVRLPKLYKNGARRTNWFGIGDPFAHFYAVPTTIQGAVMLRRIMLNGDAKLKQDVLGKISDLDFEPSNYAANEIFPFVQIIDREADIKIPYAVCTDLDIMTIRKIEDYVEKRKVVRGVLCEDWQVPYLEAAFEKNKEYIYIYPIEDSVIEGEPWKILKDEAQLDAEEVPDDFIDFDNIDEDLLRALRRSYESLDDYGYEDEDI